MARLKIFTILCLGFIVSSCKVPGGSITSGVTEQVETIVTQKDSTIKGDKVTNTLDSNMLAYLAFRFTQNEKDTIYIPSKGGETVLKYYLNSSGQMTAECETRDRYINWLEKEVTKARNEIRIEKVPVEITKLPWWPLILIGAESAFIIILLIKNFIR